MIYILIAVLISNQGAPTTINVEFHNQRACLDALAVITKKAKTGDYNIRAEGIFMCTPKG